MANEMQIKLKYNGTDFMRTYVIQDVPDSALTPASVRAAVNAFNAQTQSSSSPVQIFVYQDGEIARSCAGVEEVIGISSHDTDISLQGGEG